MSMLPQLKTVACGEGKTKQKVGYEHDINKIISKFKRNGQMPKLSLSGGTLVNEDGVVIDLTSVGDFQECQTRLAQAGEMFDALPSIIRRRFNNRIDLYVQYMDEIKFDPVKAEEALRLGILQRMPDKKPAEKKVDTTVIKKEDGEKK